MRNLGEYVEGMAIWSDGARAELLRMLQPSFGNGKEREILSVAAKHMHTLLDNW